MKKHVFTVGYDEDGLRLDTYIACNWPYGEGNTFKDILATKVLAGPEATAEVESFIHALHGIQLRLRFASHTHGPYCVNDEEGTLSADDIESMLKAMPKKGRTAWLAKARL